MGFSNKLRSIMGHDEAEDSPPAHVNVANRLGRAGTTPSRSVPASRMAGLPAAQPGHEEVLPDRAPPLGASAPTPRETHGDDRTRRPGIGARLRAALRDDEWDEPEQEPEAIDVAGRLAGWKSRED